MCKKYFKQGSIALDSTHSAYFKHAWNNYKNDIVFEISTTIVIFGEQFKTGVPSIFPVIFQ